MKWGQEQETGLSNEHGSLLTPLSPPDTAPTKGVLAALGETLEMIHAAGIF